MKIGELAKQAGLNASAIRYYERAGLLSRHSEWAGNGVTRWMSWIEFF